VTTRREFLGTLAGGLVATPRASEAQQTPKVPKLGILSTNSQASTSTQIEAFRQGLRERGYVEGQNVVIEYRFADGEPARLPKLAAELVGLKVDLIVTGGTSPTRAAQQATKTIPIVMTIGGDPIASGFISSLAKPGGNITGLTQMAGELGGKRLELLKEAFPRISRVAVLVDPASTAQGTISSGTRTAAEALGVKLLALELRGPNPDLDAVFRTATRERAGALLITGGAAQSLHRKRVVDLAAKSRLPAMYASREFVDAGGLMAYGPSVADLFRRAATYVDKILKGAKPGNLPVEQPTKFELVINLKTAKALGLTIPPSVLGRADEVIQ
jgi:putative ABC transport system substrate-binding protein